MIGTIKADRKAAAATETAPRISETGAYTGVILQAEQFDTRSGATMARLYFQADDGASAWLTLCLLKADGTESFAMAIFHTILAVAGVESVTAKKTKVRQMNGQIGEGYRMTEIEKKRVGLLLQAEPREYETQTGEIKVATDMTIRRAFYPDTGCTVKEHDAQAPAERIQADLKYFKEHPKEVRRLNGAAAPQAPRPQAAQAAPVEEFDDTPF